MNCQRLAAICVPIVLLAAVPLAEGKQYEYKHGQWVEIAPPKAGTPQALVAEIREAVRQHKFRQALHLADEFLKKYPGDPSGEQVMALAGEAQMRRGRYFEAFKWYQRQVREYPTGTLFHQALQREYEIADAFLNGRKRIVLGFLPVSATDDGLDILTRIAEQAPGSKMAQKALLRIADYHYDHQEWSQAIDAYEQFLSLYARVSDKTSYAMLQSARASYAMYRGIQYDETPLLDAEQKFRSFQENYPAQAAQANVAAILLQIKDIRAQKLYAVGEFYLRTNHPDAAAHTWRALVRLYPNSDWAKRASDRLAAVRAKPAATTTTPTTAPTSIEQLAPPAGSEEGK